MAYADVEDIELRLQRTFSESETANVEALLDSASAVLNKLVKVVEGVEHDPQREHLPMKREGLEPPKAPLPRGPALEREEGRVGDEALVLTARPVRERISRRMKRRRDLR